MPPPASIPPPGPPARAARAFTLVELLVVIAIAIVLTGLAVPIFDSFRSTNNLGTGAYNIAAYLQLARSYAISNSTYTYVGIQEVNEITATASTTTALSGTGKLVLSAVASADGTRAYAISSGNWQGTSAGGAPATGLVQIGRLLTVDNVHAPIALSANFPTAGNMSGSPDLGPQASLGQSAARRDVSKNLYPNNPVGKYSFVLPNDSSGIDYATPFNYPLGVSSPQYKFTDVIQFDPTGAARVLVSSGGSVDIVTIPWCIEICLQQCHGNIAPPQAQLSSGLLVGDVASIQLDGMTGFPNIYRP